MNKKILILITVVILVTIFLLLMKPEETQSTVETIDPTTNEVTTTDVCTFLYTPEDNEVMITNNLSSDKAGTKLPSDEINNSKECLTARETTIIQLTTGSYENIQLNMACNQGENQAYFTLINLEDTVTINVNSTEYILNSDNPTEEVYIQLGDNVTIESTNEDGVYYYYDDVAPNLSEDSSDDVSGLTCYPDQEVIATSSE